nr:uncharacterized protein LOC125628467 [Caretta caretta]
MGSDPSPKKLGFELPGLDTAAAGSIVNVILEPWGLCQRQAFIKVPSVPSWDVTFSSGNQPPRAAPTLTPEPEAPALIFLLLSLILQQDFIDWLRCSEKHRWDRKCEIVGKAFGAALLWCVILLIDGRYAECINRALKGSSTEPTAQRMPAQPPSEAYILSQVFGLFALFLIIVVYGLYTLYPFWFCCKEKEKRKQTESQRIREEQAQICMSKEEKYVQEIVQNVLVSKFKDHLKNVPNDTSIRGIFEEVQNFLNQPATSQTTQMDTELEVRLG